MVWTISNHTSEWNKIKTKKKKNIGKKYYESKINVSDVKICCNHFNGRFISLKSVLYK